MLVTFGELTDIAIAAAQVPQLHVFRIEIQGHAHLGAGGVEVATGIQAAPPSVDRSTWARPSAAVIPA